MTPLMDLRKQLSKCHHFMEHFEMTDTIYAHISARVSPKKQEFLISPYGIFFDEVSPNDLLLISDENRNSSQKKLNSAGYIIHSEIYSTRNDINCIIHSHSTAGVAVSCSKAGLLPISQFSLEFYNRISYHNYEGLATSFEEGKKIAKDLKGNNVMILRNHGLLVVGESIPAAFETMYYLEQACKVQLLATKNEAELIFPSHETCETTARQFETSGVVPKGYRLWNALEKKFTKLKIQESKNSLETVLI